MARIIEKIHDHRRRCKEKNSFNTTSSTADTTTTTANSVHPQTLQHLFYSMEFFPPKTEAGLENLLLRIDQMVHKFDPLFIDVTWGHKGSTAAKTLAIASHAQRFSGVTVLLHLSCTGLTREQIAATLQQAKSCGIQNILALRGDYPQKISNSSQRFWEPGDVSGGDCDRAIDLVKLIRTLHGNYFGIAVAGHPEGHPSSYSLDEEMIHLKQKIDAGAEFILTQFFYDTSIFFHYVKRCRLYGIHCPIIPGIMPIQSYSSFKKMTDYCRISVPGNLMQRIDAVKDDDEAVKQIGCETAVQMCRDILSTTELDGGMDGIHFYTLNLERSVSRVLETLLTLSPPIERDAWTYMTNHRRLPWRPSALENRSKEDVRPIHWANRPKSYVMRTEIWDDFPNGRWGDSASPAFGELSDCSHFYSFQLGTDEDLRNILGHRPKCEKDVYEVFAQYIEGKIPYTPWCESPLQPESFTIQRQLAILNRYGFLTINSQPSVNGLKSSHPVFGWGGSGGYVYQKAYCEFFAHPDKMDKLINMVHEHTHMILYAVNIRGEEMKSSVDSGVTALTWGVFPNKQILQPTIFDPHTFLVWSEEAFTLWTTIWLNLYESDSESYELIEYIRDTYYLVAIIDNDYVNSDETRLIWRKLFNLCEFHELEILQESATDMLNTI